MVLPGQAVAVEDACSFIQEVNERVACEAQPFPRPCDVIKNETDKGNCERFNKRMATGISSNTPPPPPPWCTGPKGRECENEDGTPIQPSKQDACATIQDINERLKCQGQPILGAGVPIEMPGVPGGSPPQDSCSAIQDVNERLKCQGIEPKLGAGVPAVLTS